MLLDSDSSPGLLDRHNLEGKLPAVSGLIVNQVKMS